MIQEKKFLHWKLCLKNPTIETAKQLPFPKASNTRATVTSLSLL